MNNPNEVTFGDAYSIQITEAPGQNHGGNIKWKLSASGAGRSSTEVRETVGQLPITFNLSTELQPTLYTFMVQGTQVVSNTGRETAIDFCFSSHQTFVKNSQAASSERLCWSINPGDNSCYNSCDSQSIAGQYASEADCNTALQKIVPPAKCSIDNKPCDPKNNDSDCKNSESACGNYTCQLLAKHYFCKPEPKATCTQEDIKSGKCTSAAGQLCDTKDGGRVSDKGNGVLTAIGCVPTEPKALIAGILRVGTGMGGGIALLLMIFGAFQMMTSSGNADQLKAGQERFKDAIIGLLFIIFSVLLLQIIGVDILNIPGFSR